MLSVLRLNPRILVYKNILTLSSVNFATTHKTPEQKAADEKKQRKRAAVHITLIQPDNTKIHSTLEEATKLSTRRDLKLVKLSDFDKIKETPVYQLMTAVQYREQKLSLSKTKPDTEKKGFTKGEKLMILSAKIADNDLQNKMKKVLSWLEKMYEVKLTITGTSDSEAAETVYKKAETIISSNGRILQKRTSGSDIKFQIIPPKQQKTPSGPPKKADTVDA